MNFLSNKIILITGGSGSFGNALVKYLLKNSNLKKIIIFSRDENKQFEMQNKFRNKNLRFFLGDVRDEDRVFTALKDVDYVIHAAAQKHVPAAEYNPFECIKTNIYGAQTVISASIKQKVKKVIAISTDKACNPINLYGATKLCAEKLFVNGNQLSGANGTRFGVVRYGNVIASRGSLIPFFLDLIKKKEDSLPLTHKLMTRFFITIEDSVKFVLDSLRNIKGGEIIIPKMNSIYILDLIRFINSTLPIKIIGLRPGEKINEILMSKDENSLAYETKKYFLIYPNFKKIKKVGKKVINNFEYSSNSKMYLNKFKVINLIKKSKVLEIL